jgi:hypothetical protein
LVVIGEQHTRSGNRFHVSHLENRTILDCGKGE